MASHSQADVVSNPAKSDRWITERIRRAVAAFKPDLVRAIAVGEAHPKILGELQTAVWTDIGHDLGARHSVRIELVIPRRIERVGPVDPLAVTADFNHLRTAGIWLAVRMRRAAYN